jgi:hypothetical protein
MSSRIDSHVSGDQSKPKPGETEAGRNRSRAKPKPGETEAGQR